MSASNKDLKRVVDCQCARVYSALTARTPKAAMSRALAALLLSLALALPANAGPQALFDLDRAVAQSQATGRPILAIGGSTGCIYCKKMAAELASDPAVREPASKYVVLLLDTDDPVQWPRWNSRYKVDGDGIPAVFIVRADGMPIYAGTGAPRDLGGFLERHLEAAGTVLDDAGLAELTTAALDLSRGWRRRDPATVIEELNKRLDPENYSLPARQIAAITDQMRKLATSRLAAAERDLKQIDRNPDAAFEAALAVLELARDYGGLAEFGDDLKARVTALAADGITTPVFERARQVIEAESLYASGKRDEATAALRSLGTAYQDTPAAAYATRMLARWEKEKRPAVSDAAPVATATVERPQADTPSGDAKKAASLVRLGKLLLSRSPHKARPYLEQAIEAAPASDAAAEAKELLAR